MLYEALTAELPHDGSLYEILEGKLERDPVPPIAINPALPSNLSALCMSLLSRLRAYLFLMRLTRWALDAGEPMRVLPGVAMYYGDDGSDRHVIVLSKLKGELVLVGVALVDTNPDASIGPETVVRANALARELIALGASPGARAAPLS